MTTNARRKRRVRREVELPPQIQDVDEDPKINLLIYSHPGVGKTTLAGTSPGKKLIIHPPTDHLNAIRTSGAKHWEVRTWTAMFEALEYLRECPPGEWDWVWLDSISLFQDTGLDDLWSQIIAERPARARYGLDRGDYGINMFRLGQWVRHIVGDKKFHFGITAHPTEMTDPFAEDPDMAGELFMPYIQGKNMSAKMCGYMNMVGYLYLRKNDKTKQMSRVLQVDATDRFYAKDGFGAFKGRIINPTIPKIMQAIQGEETA